MRYFAAFLIPAALMTVFLFQPACSTIEADILYARRLPGPPGETDWDSAVPLRIMASGGKVHRNLKPLSAQAVDQDTIHRNSASCHHGPSLDTSFPVWLRAYYDRDNFYIRLRWPDLTMDNEERGWVRQGGLWVLEGAEGDGVSLVFPAVQSPSFDCSLICHLDDWSVAGGKFQESARMHYAGEGLADIWLWRAGKGSVLDLFIDSGGIHPDGRPDGYRIMNSSYAASGKEGSIGDYLAFTERDTPYADASGTPLPEEFRPSEGTVLPAYLPLPREVEEGNILVNEHYRDGIWEITLIRPLSTGDTGDIAFEPGGTYFFGMSVMDDTIRDHHLVETVWKLKLIS